MCLCSHCDSRNLTKPLNVCKGQGIPARSYTSDCTVCTFSRCSARSQLVGIASPRHLLAILCSAVLLGCSTGPVVQRWPMVSARGLLPASSSLQGGSASSFGYCRQITKAVNLFTLPVLLGLLALLNWTATSREPALGGARELQLLQVDFLHKKGVWSFSYHTSRLVK